MTAVTLRSASKGITGYRSVTGVTHSKTGSGCIDKLLYPVTRSNLNLSIKAHLTSGSPYTIAERTHRLLNPKARRYLEAKR